MTARILQVVTDTDRRGAQVFATDLHEALVRAGRSVRTVAMAPGRTGGLDLPVLGDSRRGTATLRALRAEIKQADVVLAHGSTTLPACAITTLGTGVPFVYRQISDSRFWAPSGLRKLRVRTAMHRAAAVVALWDGSAATLHDHLGVPTSKIHVVPNGVEAARFSPPTSEQRRAARDRFGLSDDQFTVVYVGALAPEKGVDRLIAAASRLPDCQFLIVGDGPERGALETARREHGGTVSFAGSIPDPLGAYHAADLFVLPSRGGDSMPAVLIEAGLCAVPCVSTDIEAIPEIVLDGVTGRVLARGDDQSWAEVIESFVCDPVNARAMGEAGRRHCLEHFDIEVVARSWLSLIDSI